MKRRLASLLAGAAVLAAFGPPAAHAAVFRVDESGTVVADPVLQMRWRDSVTRGAADQTVTGNLRVDVRLNLMPWLNRSARIYLVLAPVTGNRVQVQWTSNGRLLPGALQSGERALVFDGPAGPAILTDTLRLRLEADGRRLSAAQRLDFHFEIEVEP
jgi:hypothetical protein